MYNTSGYYNDTQMQDETGDPSNDNYFYLYVYSGIIAGCILLSSTRPMLFCTICISASKALHKKMLNGILYTSMRFFETNPSGKGETTREIATARSALEDWRDKNLLNFD